VPARHAAASYPVELVLDTGATLGEGPVWDAARGEPVWVDILEQRVHWFDPSGGPSRSVPTPSEVGAVALRRLGTVEEIGRMICFLASEPDSGVIYGASILADRGRATLMEDPR